MTTPRIPPLAPTQWSAPLRLLLSLSPGGTRRPLNIFTTLARHEPLFWAWLPFGGKLLAGKLGARHRELVILRTAYRCGCEYERRHHREIAREVGFRDEELDAVERDLASGPWSEVDRLVLEVTDELHDTARVEDATWARLQRHFDEAQRIELTMLVGHYHLLAFTLNALRVQPEPELPSGGKASSLVSAIQRVVLRGKQRMA